MSIQVVAFGRKQWGTRLRSMAARAADPHPFMRDVLIPDMERIEEQLFLSQGRRGGGSWKALQDETIMRKVFAGQDLRINIATGALMESLTNSDSPHAVREIIGNRLDFGSTAPGATQSQKFRPIVKFTRYDAARWAKWWAQYIVGPGARRV